jgi:hypothetical protein
MAYCTGTPIQCCVKIGHSTVIQATDGNLWVTNPNAQLWGTVYTITPTGTLLQTLAFSGSTNGAAHHFLLQASSGVVYAGRSRDSLLDQCRPATKVVEACKPRSATSIGSRVGFPPASYLLCEYTSRMASTTKLGWSNGMYSELLSVNNCFALEESLSHWACARATLSSYCC